ncbi:hypothetical protein H0Z60_10205 [Ectothiorhodospiraceae bacterium WFHF3C12]|nr:hypothetical protein [Ectothiorhodospiraceae bacterium WFHF3C12]
MAEGNPTELRRELDQFKAYIEEVLAPLRQDVKELTSLAREIIRIDGDIGRQSDLVHRIGAQVDDHEQRLRKVENRTSTTSERARNNLGNHERLVWVLVTVAGTATSYLLGM